MTSASAHNGVQWYMYNGGDIDNGTFSIYGLNN